jgi:hypothetical protein
MASQQSCGAFFVSGPCENSFSQVRKQNSTPVPQGPAIPSFCKGPSGEEDGIAQAAPGGAVESPCFRQY